MNNQETKSHINTNNINGGSPCCGLKNINKTTILVFFLLVVAISGILIWQSWLKGKAPSPSPTITPIIAPTDITANWQAYTNDEYEYEIKYPEDWDRTMCLKSIIIAPKEIVELLKEAQCAVGGGKGLVLTINYRTKEQYESVILPNRITDEYKIVTLESVIVNGLEAKRYTSEFIEDTSLAAKGEIYTDVLVPCQGGYLEITLLDNQYLDIFNKMISTFKFLEPLKKDELADWQTYRNEEYGFEFKYPANIKNLAGENEETIWIDKFKQCLSGGFEYKFDYLNSFRVLACPLGNETFQQWILREDSVCIDGLDEILRNAENITVDGRQGIKIVSPPGFCESGHSIVIAAYFYDNSMIYRFVLYDTETSQEKEEFFNQILSTFKFID